MKKLKWTKKKTIISAVALLAVGAVAITTIINSQAATQVPAAKITKEDFTQTIEINGTVTPSETKVYYSEISGKIGKINVKVGDTVKKGDVLIAYDEEELELAISKAELNKTSDIGGLNGSLQSNSKSWGKVNEANTNIAVLDQQILDTENAIIVVKAKITDKQKALADEGAKLQISLIDWSDDPMSEEYENLQKLVQTNQYEQKFNSDIVQWERELDALNNALAEYKEFRSEMKSQKASADNGILTKGAKEKIEADKESAELTGEDTLEKMNEAKNGVIADFDGVVTNIAAIEGSLTSAGSELITLQSTEKPIVKFDANKYDVEKLKEGQSASIKIRGTEYDGSVTKINRMATKDANGSLIIGVEASIDNADDNVILGTEAKALITTATKEGILVAPINAVFSDKEGEFVYVSEEGKLTKKRITIGISNDEVMEIISGLDEGEVVFIDDEANLTEGMDVEASMDEDE